MNVAIQPKDDKKLSYTIMVEPVGSYWEDTTEGLLCTLDNCSKIFQAINPENGPEDFDCPQDLYEVTWTSLSKIAHALMDHKFAGDEYAVQVRQQITEEIAESQKEIRNEN